MASPAGLCAIQINSARMCRMHRSFSAFSGPELARRKPRINQRAVCSEADGRIGGKRPSNRRTGMTMANTTSGEQCRRSLRGKGISYDTGFIRNGATSRECFDPEKVKRELCIIRDELHCTAVRVIGGHPDRLELAATLAAALGLEIWFSSFHDAATT